MFCLRPVRVQQKTRFAYGTPPAAEVAGVTAGEGELAGTEAEAEGASVAEAEVGGRVPVAGFGVVAGLVWAVGVDVAEDSGVPVGDVLGSGVGEAGVGVAAGDDVVAGMTTTVAVADGLTSRYVAAMMRKTAVRIQVEVRTRRIRRLRTARPSSGRPEG